VRSFSQKQIALLQSFASQAVIAIENARLLGELRERTDELVRSVEELKALGDVGQAVSSTLDLGSVIVTILKRSVALVGADAGAIFRYTPVEHSFRLAEAVAGMKCLLAKSARCKSRSMRPAWVKRPVVALRCSYRISRHGTVIHCAI
jgi:GAF domain-containing protein